ncbi:ABC transporter ATP-binding protein [Herbaspirillum sp. HC18]|nr:ABC transporter ATP-binding protein [Herbaspirillum sp. HC18]
MSTPLLQVRKLIAGYGELPVLHGVDMAIAHGEIVALVGSNGAGKTTLLRALSGIIGNTGQIEFEGREIGRITSDRRFALGLVQVPEGRQLFDRMSVADNLLMGAYHRTGRTEINASLERVFELFPILRERSAQSAGSLSGGEQQMCAMARALMAEPKLLMIDEMSLGLAPVVVDQLLDILGKIRRQGVTVLLVEQDVFSALQIADRGYVLEAGNVVHSGTAQALGSDPEMQRAYLGL